MEGSVIYNMKTFSKFRVVFFIPILLLPFLFQKYSFAEDAKRIAVFPFEIHSKSDVLFLTSQITGCLTTELSKAEYIRVINKDTFLRLIEGKQIDKELVFGAGKKINADFVVMGSLTRLGNLISVDVTVADVKDGKTISGIFAGGTGKESLGAIAAELTDKILLKIFVKQTIEKIEFTGNHRIESGAIYNVLTSEKGKLLSERKLSSDIKAIYKMGYFSDVKVEVSGDASGKTITFILQEKPLISRIEIKGSDDIDKDDIEGVITVKPKQILNLEEVKSDVENIKTLYHDKGYLNAEVSYKIEKTGNKGTRVIFNITENKKLRIEKISFEGNKTYTDKELKDMMQVTERGFFYFISDSGLLKMDKLKQDINKLKTFYHNNGYINAQIGEPEITHDKKGIYIKIPVMEGKQFKVGKVEITGDLLSIPRADLLKKLYINKKDYFDRESIMKDIDLLSGACNDEGYA